MVSAPNWWTCRRRSKFWGRKRKVECKVLFWMLDTSTSGRLSQALVQCFSYQVVFLFHQSSSQNLILRFAEGTWKEKTISKWWPIQSKNRKKTPKTPVSGSSNPFCHAQNGSCWGCWCSLAPPQNGVKKHVSRIFEAHKRTTWLDLNPEKQVTYIIEYDCCFRNVWCWFCVFSICER